MEVSNKELLEFYAHPDREKIKCTVTHEYLERKGGLKTGNDDYIALAGTFRSNGQSGSDEFKEFYKWFIDQKYSEMLSLNALMKDTTPEKISFLERPIIDPITAEDIAALEKWHLYVSFYALEEYWGAAPEPIEYVSWKKTSVRDQWFTEEKLSLDVCGDRSGILNATQCRELLLWMYEAAAGPEAAGKYLDRSEHWVKGIKKDIKTAIYEKLHNRTES